MNSVRTLLKICERNQHNTPFVKFNMEKLDGDVFDFQYNLVPKILLIAIVSKSVVNLKASRLYLRKMKFVGGSECRRFT